MKIPVIVLAQVTYADVVTFIVVKTSDNKIASYEGDFISIVNYPEQFIEELTYYPSVTDAVNKTLNEIYKTYIETDEDKEFIYTDIYTNTLVTDEFLHGYYDFLLERSSFSQTKSKDWLLGWHSAYSAVKDIEENL